MKRSFLWSLILCCAMCVLTACSGGKSTLDGWYLHSENGTNFIITEDHGPISMSDRSKSGNLFDDLDDGDFIEITHDAIAETYPGQAGVYSCDKLSDGSFEDVPANIVADLMYMGYTFASHMHSPASEPLTVENPVTGYCGNTITEVVLGEEVFSFWGADSVALTDILINLAYDPDQICRCLPEFTVNTEFKTGFSVNLTQAYARCEDGQAALTTEQVETILEILNQNCT